MCEEKILLWDTNTWSTDVAKEFPPDPYCNGFLVFNAGASILVANGIPIPVGGTVTFGGNRGEIFKGRLQVAFVPPGVNNCIVVQKFYLASNFDDKKK
jgi:hypothetical protein